MAITNVMPRTSRWQEQQQDHRALTTDQQARSMNAFTQVNASNAPGPLVDIHSNAAHQPHGNPRFLDAPRRDRPPVVGVAGLARGTAPAVGRGQHRDPPDQPGADGARHDQP
jgi:hypothetical protein